MDELAATLSQVSLSDATPNKAQEEEAASEELEGASGGSNTLLVSGCIGAEVSSSNKLHALSIDTLGFSVKLFENLKISLKEKSEGSLDPTSSQRTTQRNE